MNKNRLNICQVSLAGNIPIILKNLKNFEKFYSNVFFYLIVPNKDLQLFRRKIKSKRIQIISENKLIKFKKFKNISNLILKKTDYYNQIQSRLTWYYQQILKLSFIIDFINKHKENIVIWDADTQIINKINFFSRQISIKYGTTSYFHRAYYDTNKTLLKSLPKYYISSLAQFVNLSVIEQKFLKKKLKIYSLKENLSINITRTIMKAIKDSHKKYNGSMFSEYELVGQSNLLFEYRKQKLISGLRDWLDGVLTNNQIKLLKLLNFKYVAYEHTHPNSFSKNMLKRKQSWSRLIFLILNKISNNLYRGIKHHIKYSINWLIPTFR